MKSSYLRGFCMLLGLLGVAQPLIAAEPFGSASLLPMPSMQEARPSYPLVSRTSYGGPGDVEEISPSDQAPTPAFAPPPAALSPDYQHAMKDSWDNAGSSGCAAPAVAASCGRPCPRFAVWGGGLLMGRAHQCDRPVTLQGGTFQNIMGTSAAAQDWSGGFEVGGAWIMPNCCNAISVGYWGLFPGDETAYRNAPNYVDGIRPVLANIDRLSYNDGVVDNVFNRMSTDTGTHYITSCSSFNSVEVNFLGNTQAWGLVPYGAGCGSCNGCIPCGTCGPSCWQFGWLAGLRFFQFNESFLMQTDENDTMIGDAGDLDELSYRINTENQLWGFQLGGQGSWYLNNCTSIYGSGRFGVFNNYITSDQYLSGQAGDAYINSGTYAGEAYRYSTNRNALAGVGQFDVGVRHQIGCHWSVFSGYRVLAAAGVATAPGQINQNFANRPLGICANDTVLLHGFNFGAQYAW